MEYQEVLGSDHYIQRLVETAASLEKTDQDFIIIEPGGEVRQEMFIR